MKDQDFAVREVERLAKQLFEDWYEAEGSGREWVAKRGLWPHSGYATGFRAVARFVLAREARLVEALRNVESCCMRSNGGGALRTILLHHATNALRAHAALDAPPQRTLREVMADLVALKPTLIYGREMESLAEQAKTLDSLLAEGKAALEHEKEAGR